MFRFPSWNELIHDQEVSNIAWTLLFDFMIALLWLFIFLGIKTCQGKQRQRQALY